MPELESVKLGDEEFPLKQITARRGLTAASLLLPYVSALKPVLEKAAGGRPGKAPSPAMGMTLLMETLNALAPVLNPETFLEVASAATGIEKEMLAEAPLEDVLAATMRALKALNLMEIVRTGMGIFGQIPE